MTGGRSGSWCSSRSEPEDRFAVPDFQRARAGKKAGCGQGWPPHLGCLNPKSLKLGNLSKRLNQSRMRGLVFASNAKLYGVGGDDDEMARLSCCDPVLRLWLTSA